MAENSGAVVEIGNIAGTLHAHGLIDLDGLLTLRVVETWLGRVRRARGLSNASPGGLWEAIVSSQAGARKWTVPITDPNRRTAGDRAWWHLTQIRNHFAELHELDALALVITVAAGERRPTNRAELVALQAGLARIAVLLRRRRHVLHPS
jgi:hypothetical protein